MSQEIENNFEERKKDWDLTGLLDDVIRRYIYQLTNDELNEINLEKASGMPDEEIKNGIKLPLATMQQRRETWGSQSKLDVQEPMIFILQSTVEKLSVGDKIPLSDADSFLIHQESGVLNYELHYLMNGTPQEYNAFLDLSKVKVADTLMDGVTHSTPPALSDYLERHQQLNDTELGAKRLQKLNCDSKNVSYANALLSYVREARECLNSGKQLPQRPTRSSITLEKPNEEVAVPLSEQTPEETAVPDLNSAPEISIPSSNNEEVMQHQNTTPESPEAEHQQAKMENLMDISLPLVDQEPFQEILQALLKNDMSQAANLLQYLGSHLDKLQEEHQKMQVEFRELKEQVNSIDERFFNDSDSVDTVQNNLDQSEKLITLNKSRLANVVLQTKSKLKTAGKNALLSFAEKIHVPKALASLYGYHSPSEHEIHIASTLQDTAAFSTLTHEFGHALAHGSVEESLNTNLHQKEFEADVMSIMFCQHYGLEITDERKSHLSGHYKDWKKSDPNNFHPDKSMRKMFDLFREHSTVLDQKIVKAFPELATKLLPQELEVNSEKKKVVNKTAKRKPKKKKTPRL